MREMDLKIIFTYKKDGKRSIEQIKDTYGKVLDFTDDEIIFKDNNYKYEFNQLDNVIELEIKANTGASKNKNAKILSELKEKLISGKYREDYYITIIFDASSQHYCKVLNIYLSEFERKLREFLYLCLFKKYDKNWIEQFDEEYVSKVKKTKSVDNINKKDVEDFLDHLTFNDIIDIFFKKQDYSNQKMEEIIEKINQDKYMTKDEIFEDINIISELRNTSLWEIICDNNIDVTEEHIDEIRKIRNKIAHNKEIKYNDFKNNEKMLKDNIQKINEGIKMFWSNNTNIPPFLFVWVKKTQDINKKLNDAIKPINDSIKAVNEQYEYFGNRIRNTLELLEPTMNAYRELGDKLNNIKIR